MPKFMRKPVIIEAMLFSEEEKDRVFNFITCTAEPREDHKGNPIILISTLDGVMKVEVGSWVIKGVKGEFYPCKPDIFAMTYESADIKDDA